MIWEENPPFSETSIYFHHPTHHLGAASPSPSPLPGAQADAEISTPETKACILEQLQKETEARQKWLVNGWGFMDFLWGGGGNKWS